MDASSALEAAIKARIRDARDQPFAVLDFDNTCIVNDVGEATLAFICRNHLLRCGELMPSGASAVASRREMRGGQDPPCG